MPRIEFVIAAVCLAFGSGAQPLVYKSTAGPAVVFDAADPGSPFYVEPGAVPKALDTNIQFTVVYRDVVNSNGRGFDHPTLGAGRRAAVEQVLTYIDSVLNEDGRCDIVFRESLTSAEYLAAAGGFFPLQPGYSSGSAYLNIVQHTDLTGPNVGDIDAVVNFGVNWYTGTGTPSANQFDFFSVMLHEIMHGLGFISLALANGSSEVAPNVYTRYDRHLETGNGKDLFPDNTPGFAGTPSDLTGGDGGVLTVAPTAVALFGAFPPVHAPSPFDSGSSISHWRQNISGGALMVPARAAAEVFRTFAPVEIGMLRDMGYTKAAEPASLPTVQFNPASYRVDEGAGTVTLTAVLDKAPGTGLSAEVNYTTVNGTATAGADYQATAGTLTFTGSQTSKTLDVPILDDSTPEGEESFTVRLEDPAGAQLGSADTAQVTIDDNDGGTRTVRFEQAAYSVTEGAAATIAAVLSTPPAAGETVSVQYSTANGTATAPGDYTPANGTLSFAAGVSRRTFTVTAIADGAAEPDETVALRLTSPVGAALGTPNEATLTIQDSSGAVFNFAQAEFTAAEDGGPALITVTLSQAPASGSSASVRYSATGDTATAGSDFTAVSGTLTFNPGETQKAFAVPILDDSEEEGSETVRLALNTPVNGTLGSQAEAILTILDDDQPLPTVAFAQATFPAEENQSPATVTVVLDRAPGAGATVTVDYATSDGTAEVNRDYRSASGQLSFSGNETQRSFPVTLINDATPEPDETVVLTLSNPVGATLGEPNPAHLVIAENDQGGPLRISLAQDAYTVAEDGGSVTLQAVLAGTLPGGVSPTVNYATGGGTATPGADYTAISGTLTFTSAARIQLITVPILDDGIEEGDETFTVTLSNPTSAELGEIASATVTILEDDRVLSVEFRQNAYSVDERVSSAPIAVRLNRAPGLGQSVEVAYSTADGSARAGLDYTAVSGTLRFENTTTERFFSVPILDDSLFEPNETVQLRLSNPVGAVLGARSTATLVILNDDPPPPPDSDGDGLSDPDEIALGTDPDNPDTDGDGYWDGFEVDWGADPTSDASRPETGIAGDIDANGAANAVDIQFVVNAALGRPVPVNADTDDSGQVDAVDVQRVINAVLAQ